MKKKLVILNNGLAGGGTERESTSLANYLSVNGFEITLIASHQSKHFFKLKDEIKFIEPKFNRANYHLIFYTLKILLYIRKNIKKSGASHVISYNESLNPYVILACFGLNVKVFVRESMHPKAKLPRITEILRSLLYPYATAVFAQTNFGRGILKKNIPNAKVVSFPNPVVMFSSDVINKNTKSIVSIGRLEKVKGHEHLIKAFSMVEDENWFLQIIGDGSLRYELEKLAIDLGIGNRVLFHGHKIEFEEILKGCEIFVLPSLKEGFPNALIEAMSVPLACISGDYYEGNIEIIEHGINGLLFKPEDVEDLYKNLNTLINDESMRIKLKENAMLVRNIYSMEKIGDELVNYMELR
jgi:GalNAc-alpha-(1->4)-GalNAc-alpha-(1->3)-diNAcBac-PP-undecaprenol alpha-1,4-N-acetyl-D-galactosaminyltransferase